jgi:hypothetical protein
MISLMENLQNQFQNVSINDKVQMLTFNTRFLDEWSNYWPFQNSQEPKGEEDMSQITFSNRRTN